MKIRLKALLVAVAATGPVNEARAEFWTAIDTVPKANVVIGIDASVTMGIEPNACGGNHQCHGDPYDPRTRLSVAKADLLATIPQFQDYFAFGGFRYQGCGRARITARVLPDNQNLQASYEATETMIEESGHCGSRENYFPDGSLPSAGCLTPTPDCSGDLAVLTSLLTGGVSGLTIPAPNILTFNQNFLCDVAGATLPQVNLRSLLLSSLGSSAFTWPAWGSTPDVLSVENDLCTPLRTELETIRDTIAGCTTSAPTIWDMSFLDADFCDASSISDTFCASGSSFENTCICDTDQDGCSNAPIPRSDCDILFTWKARQQLAVCESYSPNTFGDYFMNHHTQADNIAHGLSADFCRENVALFLTDGAFGETAGVLLEAAAAQQFYRSASIPLSNMFVFHISNAFEGQANQMMNEVSAYNEPVAFKAQNQARMQESFTKVLSRLYEGVYTGAKLTIDSLERRAYIHSFTVPGYDDGAVTGVSDTYLSWPTRIAVHEVSDEGVISSEPLFESDYAEKVASGGGGCGPVRVPGDLMTDEAYPGIRHSDLIGPEQGFP